MRQEFTTELRLPDSAYLLRACLSSPSVTKLQQGAFVKHNDNDGNIETTFELPQAFSHYTWAASSGQILVCDIQGVNNIFTDPQIHSKDGFSFGAGNMGKEGIDAFLNTHKCNSICEHLNLSPAKKALTGGWANPPPLTKAKSSWGGFTSKMYDGAVGNALSQTKIKNGATQNILGEQELLRLLDAASDMGSSDDDDGSYSPRRGTSPMRGNSPIRGNSPMTGNSPLRGNSPIRGGGSPLAGVSPNQSFRGLPPKARSGDSFLGLLPRAGSGDSGGRSTPLGGRGSPLRDLGGRGSPMGWRGSPSPTDSPDNSGKNLRRRELTSPDSSPGDSAKPALKRQGSLTDMITGGLKKLMGGNSNALELGPAEAECRHCGIEGPAAVIRVSGPHHE